LSNDDILLVRRQDFFQSFGAESILDKPKRLLLIKEPFLFVIVNGYKS
jgi:hypothetical protein